MINQKQKRKDFLKGKKRGMQGPRPMKDIFFFAFYVNIDSDETSTHEKERKKKEQQGAAEEKNK